MPGRNSNSPCTILNIAQRLRYSPCLYRIAGAVGSRPDPSTWSTFRGQISEHPVYISLQVGVPYWAGILVWTYHAEICTAGVGTPFCTVVPGTSSPYCI